MVRNKAAVYFSLFCALLTTQILRSETVDCQRSSLAEALSDSGPNRTIVFTGVCYGPIVINTNLVTLRGTGAAAIDGRGKDALTIIGAHGVTLADFEVRNGLNGISGINGASLNLSNITVHDNALFGITLQTSSSAITSGITIRNSGIHGLDLETGSAAIIKGSFVSTKNRVFGINVNGSSITFSQATLTASSNALGMQVATNANAFLNDPATTLNFTANLATGLTVVSGGHLVSFGGTIISSGNGLEGVSVNSKGGLDLDAGSLLNSFNNGGDGVLLQQGSVMTVFNIPQFSGAPGFSTVNTHGNTGNGLTVADSSTFTVANQAKLLSSTNAGAGLFADGAAVTLVNSMVSGNTGKDLQFRFGTRADLPGVTFGSYSCDATVLQRGAPGLTCPH